MHLFCTLCRRSCSLIPWYFGAPLIFLLTVVVLLWTSFSQRLLPQAASLSTLVPIAVHLGLSVAPCFLPTMCCALVISTFPRLLSLSLPNSSHPPSVPRVRDWSTVVASCHHSLSAWHQSVLAHVSGPLPDFPARASSLDCLFDSLTQILFDCASLHSRRRPGSRSRTRQPLWWNDACYHALVARNGSWRDFRRSGSR